MMRCVYFLPTAQSSTYIVMSSPNKTRNSAIADKPRDALVQYAVAWLTPNKPIPHNITIPPSVVVLQKAWA